MANYVSPFKRMESSSSVCQKFGFTYSDDNTSILPHRTKNKKEIKLDDFFPLKKELHKMDHDAVSLTGDLIQKRNLILKQIKNFITRHKFSKKSYHLAVYLLDYLIHKLNKNFIIPLENIGVGCLIISSNDIFILVKFIEIDFRIPNLTYYQIIYENLLFKIEELKKIEIFCLVQLNYQLTFTIPFSIIELSILKGIIFQVDLIKDNENKIKDYMKAYQIIYDILDVTIQNFEYFNFPAHHVAFSAIYLSREILKISNPWNIFLEKFYSINFNEFKQCYEFVKENYNQLCLNKGAPGLSKNIKKKKARYSVPPLLRSKNEIKINAKFIHNTTKKNSFSNSKSVDYRVLNTSTTTTKFENLSEKKNSLIFNKLSGDKKVSKFVNSCNITATTETKQENNKNENAQKIRKGKNFSMAPSVREIKIYNQDEKILQENKITHKNLFQLEKQRYNNKEFINKKMTSISKGISLLKLSKSKEKKISIVKDEREINFKLTKSKFINKMPEQKTNTNLVLKTSRLNVDDLKIKIIKSNKEFDNLNQNNKNETEGRRISSGLHSHR